MKKSGMSYYSKRNVKDSFIGTQSNLNMSNTMDRKSREGSPRDKTWTNDSRLNMTGGSSKAQSVTASRVDSTLFGTTDETSTNIDPNKSYRTIMGADPVERLRQK